MSTQTALVTGALTGIGREAAIAFAQQGYNVVVAGRRQEAGQSLAAELRGFGVGPGETDLELGERDAVDDDGLGVLAPDPGVPKSLAEFESLDLKTVMGHGPVLAESKP